jgi:hypothetical protein
MLSCGRMIRLRPTPSPTPPSVSSNSDTQEDLERADGRGWARSRSIRPQESLVLYNSFSTLCCNLSQYCRSYRWPAARCNNTFRQCCTAAPLFCWRDSSLKRKHSCNVRLLYKCTVYHPEVHLCCLSLLHAEFLFRRAATLLRSCLHCGLHCCSVALSRIDVYCTEYINSTCCMEYIKTCCTSEPQCMLHCLTSKHAELLNLNARCIA